MATFTSPKTYSRRVIKSVKTKKTTANQYNQRARYRLMRKENPTVGPSYVTRKQPHQRMSSNAATFPSKNAIIQLVINIGHRRVAVLSQF